MCFVPFNIVVLVYLYKQGIPLPTNSVELYRYFICLTICRFLAKNDKPRKHDITKLIDLPEPYNKVIKQLAKLSLDALNENKLIFSLDDVKAVCADIMAIPGAINGFGLLQAVEHDSISANLMTLNFVHFSIQEYLAAYHIANLQSHEDELRVIEKNFWSDIHFNMFSMYITLTKGQRPAFKHFLSDGDKTITISDKFLNNQLQSLHLYRCFYEADDDSMCKSIEKSKIFSDTKIDFRLTAISATDVECIAVFLTTSSHKEWKELNLSHCYIQDHGLRILHHGLCHCDDVSITITELILCNNGLTMQSSSLISEIAVKCKVKMLDINENNTIGEDHNLYSMLTDQHTMLQGLYMHSTNLSSEAAISLFNSLKINKTLKWLSINRNTVTDDACNAIATALKSNSYLVTLGMYGNPLGAETIENIVRSLQNNRALQLIWLPRCPEDTKKIISTLETDINKTRESQGCQVKLGIGYGRF